MRGNARLYITPGPLQSRAVFTQHELLPYHQRAALLPAILFAFPPHMSTASHHRERARHQGSCVFIFRIRARLSRTSHKVCGAFLFRPTPECFFVICNLKNLLQTHLRRRTWETDRLEVGFCVLAMAAFA